MKHLKMYEDKLKIKNFKDLDNWDVKQQLDNTKLTGKKNLDLSLGQKVIDLFEEHRLFIKIDTYSWVGNQDLLLPDEKNLKEHRVEIGVKESFEDWIDYEYGDKPDDKTDEELREEYDSSDIDFNNRNYPAWSVFLQQGESDLKTAAMADSSVYLKLITSAFPDIIVNYLDTNHGGALSDDSGGFKKFINNKNVKITNDNVELVSTINYRLWKDSKAFACFRDDVFNNGHETKEFFSKWLKLIK